MNLYLFLDNDTDYSDGIPEYVSAYDEHEARQIIINNYINNGYTQENAESIVNNNRSCSLCIGIHVDNSRGPMYFGSCLD